MLIMLNLKLIHKIMGLLNSDETPTQIGLGFAMGSMLIIAATPFFPLKLILLLLIFILNVSFKGMLLSLFVMKLLTLIFRFALTPLYNSLGESLLVNSSSLYNFWTSLYNTPFIPFTNFNNTYVMGSIAFALILFIPLFFGINYFIKYYRSKLQDKIINAKWFKAFKSTKLGIYVFKIINFLP